MASSATKADKARSTTRHPQSRQIGHGVSRRAAFRRRNAALAAFAVSAILLNSFCHNALQAQSGNTVTYSAIAPSVAQGDSDKSAIAIACGEKSELATTCWTKAIDARESRMGMAARMTR